MIFIFPYILLYFVGFSFMIFCANFPKRSFPKTDIAEQSIYSYVSNKKNVPSDNESNLKKSNSQFLYKSCSDLVVKDSINMHLKQKILLPTTQLFNL